ncbi:uncharacterized protein BDR25DRAFT_320237 [Lindgomyces ingoldianus]|uniref:Uncharacterized protein n=1 Tax=Lindgomyces ingoldianus TaxID=673940 RepID=A0ACB6Q8M9_9PLEO|nr:uncharacterized protein BDR25DRAFT_320237 [Lindgomyces ingoldianus]KAF2463232.1 hypothetical protein BDR25DRAFT_320237 [Lindgomyces ingoldianus]
MHCVTALSVALLIIAAQAVPRIRSHTANGESSLKIDAFPTNISLPASKDESLYSLSTISSIVYKTYTKTTMSWLQEAVITVYPSSTSFSSRIPFTMVPTESTASVPEPFHSGVTPVGGDDENETTATNTITSVSAPNLSAATASSNWITKWISNYNKETWSTTTTMTTSNKNDRIISWVSDFKKANGLMDAKLKNSQAPTSSPTSTPDSDGIAFASSVVRYALLISKPTSVPASTSTDAPSNNSTSNSTSASSSTPIGSQVLAQTSAERTALPTTHPDTNYSVSFNDELAERIKEEACGWYCKGQAGPALLDECFVDCIQAWDGPTGEADTIAETTSTSLTSSPLPSPTATEESVTKFDLFIDCYHTCKKFKDPWVNDEQCLKICAGRYPGIFF